MNEKLIERKLRVGVKARGGKALKFYSPFETGWPDRIVLMPGGKIYWVETKTTGKQLKPRQRVVKRFLESLGFRVTKIDSQDDLDNFFKRIDDGKAMQNNIFRFSTWGHTEG